MFPFAAVIVIVAAFVFTRGGATRDDSISENWITPTSSAAKKNPIAQGPGLHRRRTKNLSKALRCLSWKKWDGDGPGIEDLGIPPTRLSDPHLRAESDSALFWIITSGKSRCPVMEDDSPKPTAGT